MLFFKLKNDSVEFMALAEFKHNIDKILSLYKYISKKEYTLFCGTNKEIYDKLSLMEKESVLNSWCKNNGIISIDTNDYSRIKVLKSNLNENDYKIILAGMKF